MYKRKRDQERKQRECEWHHLALEVAAWCCPMRIAWWEGEREGSGEKTVGESVMRNFYRVISQGCSVAQYVRLPRLWLMVLLCSFTLLVLTATPSLPYACINFTSCDLAVSERRGKRPRQPPHKVSDHTLGGLVYTIRASKGIPSYFDQQSTLRLKYLGMKVNMYFT